MHKFHMSRPDSFRVNDLLKEHLEVLDDRIVRYKDEWSDEKIAQFVNPKLNRGHVANLRTEMYGTLAPATKGSVEADAQFVALNKVITEFRTQLDDLRTKHNTLALDTNNAHLVVHTPK